MKNIDFSKLKEEINNRKSEQTNKNEQLGFENKQPKSGKNFLQGLVHAHNRMVETDESRHIKKVAVKSDEISGDPISKHINTPKPQTQNNKINEQSKQQNISIDGEDRIDGLYAEIERRSKEYNQKAGKELFPENLYNQNINENTQQPVQQSPNNIDEKVIQIMEQYFGNNMIGMLQTIITNMFTNEKIKQGIIDNENIIKEIVKDTIRELKKKKTS